MAETFNFLLDFLPNEYSRERDESDKQLIAKRKKLILNQEKIMKVIENWKVATEKLAIEFTKKYFPTEIYEKDTFWVANEIGGVFYVADMFFGLDRIIEALENKATFDQLYSYYHAEIDYCTENPDKPMHTNFKNYIKHGFIGASTNEIKIR